MVSYSGINYAVNLKRMDSLITHFDYNKPEDTLPAFASLQPVLKTNPYYLTAYANLLSLSKDYGLAIENLSAALSYQSSYSIIIELGRQYEQSGDEVSALAHWALAHRMIPARFEPLYLQIACYHRSGNYHKADSLTTLFLKKERKWGTIRIDRMLKDVKQWQQNRLETNSSPFERSLMLKNQSMCLFRLRNKWGQGDVEFPL